MAAQAALDSAGCRFFLHVPLLFPLTYLVSSTSDTLLHKIPLSCYAWQEQIEEGMTTFHSNRNRAMSSDCAV